jgi:hypothetical protein
MMVCGAAMAPQFRRQRWWSLFVLLCVLYLSSPSTPRSADTLHDDCELIASTFMSSFSLLRVSASLYVSPQRVRVPTLPVVLTSVNVTGVLRLGDSGRDVEAIIMQMQNDMNQQADTIAQQASMLQTLSSALDALTSRMRSVESEAGSLPPTLQSSNSALQTRLSALESMTGNSTLVTSLAVRAFTRR